MNTMSVHAVTVRESMEYNINVFKSVWRRLRKPSRATLDAIFSQNALCTEANGKTDAQRRRNPIPITFGLGEAFDGFAFPHPAGGHPEVFPGFNYEKKPKAGRFTHK